MEDLKQELARRLKKGVSWAAAEGDEEIEEQEVVRVVEAGLEGLERLLPEMTNQDAYQALLDAIREALADNESIPHLTARLKQLGGDVKGAVKVAAHLLPGERSTS